MTEAEPRTVWGPFAGDLQPTGERTLPGIPEENYWYQRHVAAYRFASNLVEGREILDAGCGEGYGSEILTASARDVVGVDIDADTLVRAGRRYPRARFERADLLELPFPDASFDAVVSLQVIEHLSAPRAFLAECARVLRPAGLLVLSTPNRLTFSPEGPRNPFHVNEVSEPELHALLSTAFRVERTLGSFHGSRIRRTERMRRRSFPEMLLDRPAPEWPRWLHRAVGRIVPDDFEIRDVGLDRALDLLAVAHR